MEDNEDFKNCTKCWICDKDHIDTDVKFSLNISVTANESEKYMNFKSIISYVLLAAFNL